MELKNWVYDMESNTYKNKTLTAVLMELAEAKKREVKVDDLVIVAAVKYENFAEDLCLVDENNPVQKELIKQMAALLLTKSTSENTELRCSSPTEFGRCKYVVWYDKSFEKTFWSEDCLIPTINPRA